MQKHETSFALSCGHHVFACDDAVVVHGILLADTKGRGYDAHALVRSEGPSKWFDANAAKAVGALVEQSFGFPLHKSTVRNCGVQAALWLTPEGKPETVAAALLVVVRASGAYLVRAVCVDPLFREASVGTLLMRFARSLVLHPQRAIELHVNTNEPSTPWLLTWYRGLGFSVKHEDKYEREFILVRDA